MKCFIVLFVFITFSIYSQNEADLLIKYKVNFEKANSYILENEHKVETSIAYFNNLIKSTRDDYFKNSLKVYKASQERRINVKTALNSLKEVDNYLLKNTNYKQLTAFYNTVLGRIAFENQQNCALSNKIYLENLNLLNEINNPFNEWNLIFETKTGLINTLLCLQKDEEALEYLKQLETEINPKKQLKEYIYVLSVSGYIHTKFSNYEEGEKYFKKVVVLLEKSKYFIDNYLAACNNLAHIYKVTNNTNEGIKILEKALLKAQKTNDTNGLFLIENNLGFLYVKKERYKDAEKLGLLVLKEANEKEFAIHAANANRLLGTVNYYLGNYKTSEHYIDKSITFFRDFKNLDLLRNALDIKNKLLIKTNQFEKATLVNSEIISLLDSVSLNSNIQNLQKNLVAYETEKKNNEITILKQKDEINLFKLEKQKQYIFILVIGLLLLLLISIIIFKYQKKINTIQNLALRSKLTRSQFNPHYINNAFTSLQATLIENDLDENLINYTSNISRFSRLLLESTFTDEWSLFEEKQMMENYLKTQLYRLENSFDFTLENSIASEDLQHLKIPSALTQTVLENAIEHGGFSKQNNGKIEIKISKTIEQVNISIQNTIFEIPTLSTSNNTTETSRGLDITRQRLELHGKIHHLKTDFNFSKDDKNALVIFKLPLISN